LSATSKDETKESDNKDNKKEKDDDAPPLDPDVSREETKEFYAK
jgi:hypothetical protein